MLQIINIIKFPAKSVYMSHVSQQCSKRLICNIKQAQTLLKSLLIIGVILGLLLGIVGTSVPALFPNIFTPDPSVMQQVSSIFSI